jgi:hypothetical protein
VDGRTAHAQQVSQPHLHVALKYNKENSMNSKYSKNK